VNIDVLHLLLNPNNKYDPEFLFENNPKADIQVNESNVVWYTTAVEQRGFSTNSSFNKFLLWSHSRFSHRM
jgi:hypothetical protein